MTTRQGRTDIANAERFKRLYGDRVRYCHPWKKWLVWDGKRWKTDNDGSIIRLAMTVADDVWNEARKTNDHEALKHAVRVSSSMSIGAMLKLVRAMVPILPEDMDQNAFLLNCPNGTIDLRTGGVARASARRLHHQAVLPSSSIPMHRVQSGNDFWMMSSRRIRT